MKYYCYKPLIDALERETGLSFPECLLSVNFSNMEDKFEMNIEDSIYCICGVDIRWLYYFTVTNSKEIIIGSSCQENILTDKELLKNDIVREHWKNQINKAKKARKQKKQCLRCKMLWYKPRCLYKGLCQKCQKEKKELEKTEILLPKFKGKKLRDIKDEKDYMIFCINNKTRQHQLFKDYLKFFN